MITVQGHWREVVDFYGVREDDLQTLHAHKEFFDHNATEIIEDFYKQLTSLPNLVNIFKEHSTLERLKKTQVWYFKTLSTALIDDDYIAGREKIGAVHARIGLSAIWFLGGYSIYLRLIADKIASSNVTDGAQLYQAVSRRFLFDSAIILEQYVGNVFKANEAYRNNMEEVSVALMDSVRQVSAIASDFANTASELAQSQETVVKTVNDLTRDSEKIDELGEFVDDVASQTHLLGLNAAIEAARVGDHGNGFAVVANEVRKLAERAKGSSRDIKASVVQVIAQVNTINEQVQHTMAISEQQAASAQELSALIQNIEGVTQRLIVDQ